MNKTMVAFGAALLLVMSLGLWGCGDDDPVDPGADACSITVNSPAAGDIFVPGDDDQDNMRIRWTKSGDAALVMIELLKAGNLVEVIHPSVPNAGFYSWTASNLGAANGSDFAIRVSALGVADCSSTSGLFTMNSIVGCTMDFTNLFPDSLLAGDIFNLTWESANTTGFVDIELRKQDQGLGYIATRTEDDGSFDWTVDSLHNGTYDYYFLRIQDSDVADCFADSVTFKIQDDDICYIDVTGPQPGVIWDEGTDHEIIISPASEVSVVNLRLYTGNVYVGLIASNISVDDFPYIWTVNDFDNLQGTSVYNVMAINSEDQYCLGQSGFFTINSQ